eukprot:scaffold71510_cov29-Phaeocystis_antarctica.AAC.2
MVPHGELQRRVALIRTDVEVGARLDEYLRTVRVVAVVARPVERVIVLVAVRPVGVSTALEKQARRVRLVAPHGICERCGAVRAVASWRIRVEVLPLVEQLAKPVDVPLMRGGPERRH